MKTIIKNKFRIAPVLLIIAISFATRTSAQDAQFSQFYNSPLTLNPSLTGAFNGDIRLQTSYRNQWSSVPVPYSTFNVAYDMGLGNKSKKAGFLGAGINIMTDKAGSSAMGTTGINLSCAYHTKVSEYSNLSAGIIIGFAQRSINLSKLQWNSQYDGTAYDPNLPSLENVNSNSKVYADAGAGIQWSRTQGEMYSTANNQFNLSAGLAVFHLNGPNVSYYSDSKEKLPFKIVGHCSAQIGLLHSKYSIVPMLLYISQGKQTNLIGGGMIRIKLIEESKFTNFVKGAAFSFGSLYRVGDAAIPCIQMEFANYALGISYDVNLSGLNKATSGKGGIEISLRFVNPNPFKSEPQLKTPRFFN